ncbi:MAG: Uncharacterised protein [Cellulomonadaceae bacterium TMED98]|nr:MAG: Uncharacterised protein [Cellulomonadaceae bacterium TMED98]
MLGGKAILDATCHQVKPLRPHRDLVKTHESVASHHSAAVDMENGRSRSDPSGGEGGQSDLVSITCRGGPFDSF